MDYFHFKVVRKLKSGEIDKFKVLKNKVLYVDFQATIESTIESWNLGSSVEEICVDLASSGSSSGNRLSFKH